MQNQQEYLYKGPNHAANLNDMRFKDKYCDVTIKVNGEEIRAHKVILAANLKYFETMFSSDSFQESQDGIIAMQSVEKADLELFVSYAYTGEILLTDSNALNLLELANYLSEDGIKEACVEFLKKHLKVEETFRAYKFADAIDCPLLKNVAKTKIILNIEDCSRSAEYLNLNPEILMCILSGEKSQSIQLQKMLLDGIMRWIMHSPEDRKNYLNDLVNGIDITTLKESDVKHCLYENVLRFNNNYGIRKDLLDYYKEKQIERQTRVMVLLAINETVSYQFYNFIEKNWTPQVVPRGVREYVYSPGAVFNDKLYFVSEISRVFTLKVFDSVSKQITKVYSGISISESATVCACNRFLYICGGQKPNKSVSDQVLRYDPLSNSFERLASLRAKRQSVAATFYQGYLYVLGGHNGASVIQWVEKYDLVKNEWTTVPSMCERRQGHAVAELNGKLYACGGYSGTYYKSSVEVYDSTTNRWQQVASMNKARGFFLVVPYQNKLLAIGEKVVEVYDPNENQWRMNEEMSAGLEIDCCIGGLFPPTCITNEQ